jgi:hypothetical protein
MTEHGTRKSPGLLREPVALLRTAWDATVHPARFLETWREDDGVHLEALRLLAVNGALVGLTTYVFHALGLSPDNPLEAVARKSKAASIALDAMIAVLPLALVWSQVLATRISAALLRAGTGWQESVRQAGFLAAVYLPATAISLAVVAARPEWGMQVSVANLAVDLVYGTVAFRKVHRLSGVRALSAAALSTVLALVLFLLLQAAGAVVVSLLAARG